MDPIFPIDEQLINVTRTVYSGYLQTHKYLGITPYVPQKNTTLNEKFNIMSDDVPAGGQMPDARYLVIGNMGHRNVRGQDGADESEVVIHRANHAALYNHIPFVMRSVDNDITASQRANYCLRTTEVHDGKTYVVYYGRRFDVSLVKPQLIEIEVVNGVQTTKPYIPTIDDLNPIRPEISNTGTVIGSNRNISSSAIITIALSAEDVHEITQAHRLRTGSNRSPVISEIGICSGIDKLNEATSTAGSFQYNEVIACQINTHIATNHPIGYNSSGLTMRLDVGTTEPTLGDQAVHEANIIP